MAALLKKPCDTAEAMYILCPSSREPDQESNSDRRERKGVTLWSLLENCSYLLKEVISRADYVLGI